MDIPDLRYFVAIAETGSFSRAATKLGVTQPTLSRRIGFLEEDLKAPLLYRHGRGATLTSAGQELYDASRQILHELDNLRNRLLDHADRPNGLVRFGVPPSIGKTLGAVLARTFEEACPSARLHIVEGFSGHLLDWVETGHVNLAILYDARRSHKMLATPLLTENLFLISQSKVTMNGKALPLKDLATRTLVLPGNRNGLRRVVDAAFERASISVVVKTEIDSVDTLKQLVTMGNVDTILPFGAVYEEVESGHLHATPLASPDMRAKLVLATPLNEPVTKATHLLIGLVRREIARCVDRGIIVGKAASGAGGEMSFLSESAPKVVNQKADIRCASKREDSFRESIRN